MKRLQVVIRAIYAMEVPDDFEYNEPSEVQNKVGDYLAENNMTPENEFFDNLEVVCSECGISLDNDEEEYGICANCEGGGVE